MKREVPPEFLERPVYLPPPEWLPPPDTGASREKSREKAGKKRVEEAKDRPRILESEWWLRR